MLSIDYYLIEAIHYGQKMVIVFQFLYKTFSSLKIQYLILTFIFPSQSIGIQLKMTSIYLSEYTWSCYHEKVGIVSDHKSLKQMLIYSPRRVVIRIQYQYYYQIYYTNKEEDQIVELVLNTMRMHYVSLLTYNYHRWQVTICYS